MMRTNRSKLLAALLLTATAGTSVFAQGKQEVVLENGMRLEGQASKIKAISSDRRLQGPGDSGAYRLVDQNFKRYYLPHRLVASIGGANNLKRESFKLKHRIVSKKRIPDFIGGLQNVTPWDKNGVRTVTLRTQSGPITVTQAMWQLTPKYVWVRSLDYDWQFGIPTTSIDSGTLHKVLQNAINMNNPGDCMSVCRYLIAAEKLPLADQWVTKTAADFPALKDQCEAATVRLKQEFAKQLVSVLQDRSKAGQHQLVKASLAQFPTEDLPVAVVNSVETLKKEYQAKETAIAKIHEQLEQLEAVLDDEVIAKVQPLRTELKTNLDVTSLNRLMAYINLAKDQTLKPEERLAIAYSGWLLGSANAITNLPETLGLWEAREHVAAYLGSEDPLVHRRSIDELSRLEGVTPRTLSQLLETSPTFPANEIKPGEYAEMTAATGTQPAKYKVALPPEYSPFKTYPLIVALHQAGEPLDAQLAFWSGTIRQPGQGQRRGYIVIAPDYAIAGAAGYESNSRSHEVVLASIRDAFRRFSVDTDRVFLTGHGTGGSAVFDIAMSHPGVFAGAIPICGRVGPEAPKLTTNGATLPWYVVTGEKHLSLDGNSSVLHQIATMKRNEKVIVCEYKDRGYERYYDEIQLLFQWMDGLRREPISPEFAVSAVRPETNQFFWVEASDFPDYLATQDFSRGAKPNTIRSIEFQFRVSQTNKMTIRRCGSKEITLRLIDGVIDFEKPLRVSGIRIPRGRPAIDPRPAISDVLEDFRLYRDRHRIALQRVRL